MMRSKMPPDFFSSIRIQKRQKGFRYRKFTEKTAKIQSQAQNSSRQFGKFLLESFFDLRVFIAINWNLWLRNIIWTTLAILRPQIVFNLNRVNFDTKLWKIHHKSTQFFFSEKRLFWLHSENRLSTSFRKSNGVEYFWSEITYKLCNRCLSMMLLFKDVRTHARSQIMSEWCVLIALKMPLAVKLISTELLKHQICSHLIHVHTVKFGILQNEIPYRYDGVTRTSNWI